MPLTQISVPLTKDQAYALVDAVMDEDGLALTASAHEEEDGAWVFEATCADEPDVSQFGRVATLTLGGNVGFSVERIDPEIDWVFKSLESLQPVEAGGFYVHGSHNEARPKPGLVPVNIEAAQAFGTGHHETTAGCLEAIAGILKRRQPAFMLDVGTGTGILAIAFAKRTRRVVIAGDIDPISVRTTRANARLNEVSGLVHVVEAAGLDHDLIRRNRPYDLIVANILAGPLLALAPAIGRAASPKGSVVLSGLLVGQGPRIIAAYRAQDMFLVGRIAKKEWLTLILEKR